MIQSTTYPNFKNNSVNIAGGINKTVINRIIARKSRIFAYYILGFLFLKEGT